MPLTDRERSRRRRARQDDALSHFIVDQPAAGKRNQRSHRTVPSQENMRQKDYLLQYSFAVSYDASLEGFDAPVMAWTAA